MRRSSVVLASLSLVCALSATWSWWQLRAERARVAMLEERLATLESARQESTLTASALAVSQHMPAAPSASPATAAPVGASSTDKTQQQELQEQVRASFEREREMLSDPAYRKMRYDELRRHHAQYRDEYIRVVGMTPEQAERVIDLSAERMVRINELHKPLSEEDAAELNRFDEVFKAQVSELLGTEKYERWSWYQKSSMDRHEATRFRAQLSTSEPLQDRQIDELVEVFYNERVRRMREYNEYLRSVGVVDRSVVSPQDQQRRLDIETAANQRVHDTMAGSLSRTQLASLDEMLAARLVPIETALRMQLEGKLAHSN